MRKLIALWLASVAVVAVVASALTAIYISRTTEQRTLQTAAALPWSMGVQSVQHGPNDSTDAKGVFINLPVGCGVFSPNKAMIVADEVSIRRVPNTRRDVDAELRGNVHIRYTVQHD
jgi:hypothetical protein